MKKSDKIAVQLIGGLGNQLFILAHGYKLARESNRGLVIDKSKWYAGRGQDPEVYSDTIFKNFEFGQGDPIPVDYYQGEKYFQPYGKQFVKKLDIKLNRVDQVAIHVRRTDYIGSKHEVCDLDYYMKAMAIFNEKQAVIFTDDPDYCHDAFPGIPIFTGTVLESFIAMASHKIIICSNSSFSWWASYIGNSVAIVPKRWYKNKVDNNIYRKGMIKL